MGYRVQKQYAGLYYVLDTEDGQRVASIGKFNPGPMVHLQGGSIWPPEMAKAIARAISRLANDLEREATHVA